MFCTKCGTNVEQSTDGQCPECKTPMGGRQGGSQEIEAAGFWIRLPAFLLDGFFATIISGIVAIAAGLLMDVVGMKTQASIVAVTLYYLSCVLYFIVPIALYGQTLGKRICGLKVEKIDGSPITWGTSIIRYLGYIVSMLPLYFGFIWIGISSDKRGLHDLIAGTRVVYVDSGKKSSAGLVVGIVLGLFFLIIPVIGIMAAIAIPKFAELIRKSSEGAAKGNLGAIRSAMSIYYGDMEGQYPAQLESLTAGGKYLTVIPAAKTPNFHPDSATVHYLQGLNDASQADTGGWGYVNNPRDKDYGNIFVNCTHTDTRGKSWDSY